MCGTLVTQWWFTGTYPPASTSTPAASSASPSLLGIDPMASSAWLPVATRPSLQWTATPPSPVRSMPSARAPFSSCTPRRSSSSSRAAATSGSLPGSTCCRLTIRLTLLPSDENMCTNSTPVTPDPITTRCSGSSGGGYASRVVSTRSPSTSAQSGMRGRLPVETRMASASISLTPSSFSTAISCGPLSRPLPWIMRTPWLRSSWTMLDSRRSSIRWMRFLSRSRSSVASGPDSPMPPLRSTIPMASAVAIIALDGMQSRRCAEPPTMSRSISVTSAPRRAAVVAAVLPAGPPPMITKRRGTAPGYVSGPQPSPPRAPPPSGRAPTSGGRSSQPHQAVVGREKLAREAQADDHHVGGDAAQDQVHDRRLHQHAVDRVDARQDEAGHGAGQEHQPDGLGALQLRRERGPQCAAHERLRGLLPRLPERQPGLHLRAPVGELAHDAASGHHHAADRVADHHAGDGHDRPPDVGVDAEAEHDQQADGGRCGECKGRQPQDVGDLGRAAPDGHGGEDHPRHDPEPPPDDGCVLVDHQHEQVAHGEQLGDGPPAGPQDLALEPQPLPHGQPDGHGHEDEREGQPAPPDRGLIHGSQPSSTSLRKRSRSSADATRPSMTTSTSSASRSACSRSWVTHTTGRPSAARSRAVRSRRWRASGSSADVGSSMSSTSGRVTRVRARHMRCDSPPDRSSAERSRNVGARPAPASTASSASLLAAGSATSRLSRTVPGNGAGRWKTIPTRRRRARGSIDATDSPRKRTTPAVGTSRRFSSRRSMVFPAPDG